MFTLKNLAIRSLRGLYQQPWPQSSAIASTIDASQLIEEEKSPFYNRTTYYPAGLGEILNGRYQLATKLGHGSRSTVWLARDLYRSMALVRRKYVALKINSNARKRHSDAEINILKRITEANRRHEGWDFVRVLLDSFYVQGPSERHACFVFEPLREPLWLYRQRFADAVIPPELLKIMLQMVLHALDYLHSECHIIHTDLKPDNIMVKLEDKSHLSRSARDEYENPLPQKHCDDGRTIYMPRNNYGRATSITGLVQVTDFDLAVGGDEPQSGCIQAEVYRAPEVILDRGFTYSADIWNLGVMLWDVIENRSLFTSVDEHAGGEYDDLDRLASITALLGDAPKELLDGGKRTEMFYTPENVIKKPPHQVALENFTFEKSLSHIRGEEKKMFLNFVRRMIKWNPEERSTAKELLDDPWLHEDFPQE